MLQSGVMGRRASKIAVSAVLLTCLICAVSEALDRWDRSFQTGNETESSVLLLALSLGTAYLVVRHSFAVAGYGLCILAAFSMHSIEASGFFFLARSAVVTIFGSPPALALRI